MEQFADSIRQQANDEASRRWDEAAERLKFATAYAHAGLKGLFLANGGAIVALLTFLGNAQAAHVEKHKIWWAFVCFTLALSLVLAAYIAGYASHASSMQATFARYMNALRAAQGFPGNSDAARDESRANFTENLGLAFVVASLALFVCGAFVALDAIT